MSDIAMGVLMVELRAQAGQLLAQFDNAARTVMVSTNSMSARLGAFEKGLAIVTAAGAAAVAGFSAAAVREFTKFDEAMLNSLANMTGVTEQMKTQMEQTAREFSIQQGEAADDIANSYLALANANFTVEESMKALTAVEAYGQVTNLSMNQSALALLNTMRSLNLTTGTSEEKIANLTRVSDVYVKATQMTSITFNELSAIMQGRFGVALNNANASIEEGTAAMMVLTDAGMRGGRAGMMLASVYQELQRTAVDNKEIWDEFGISAYDAATGKLKPLADIMEELSGILANTTDEEKKTALGLLGFSTQSEDAIRVMVSASDKLRDYQKGLEGAGGSAQKTADILSTSLTESFKQLSAATSEILRQFGEELDPLVRAITGIFKDAATNTGEWKGQVHELAVMFKDSLVWAIERVGDIINGWTLIIKTGQVAFGYFFQGVLWGVNQIVQGFKKYVDTLVESYNWYVRLNNLTAKYNPLGRIMEEQETPEWIQSVADATENYAKAAKEATAQSLAELDVWLMSKKAGDELAERLLKEENEKKRRAEEAKALADAEAKAATDASNSAIKEASALKKVNEELRNFFAELDKHDLKKYTEVSPDVVKLRLAIQDPWIQGQKELKKYDQMLKDGAITLDEYRRAVAALNMEGDLVDPFDQARLKLEQYNRALRDGVVSLQQYADGVNSTLAQMSPDLFGAKTIGPGSEGVLSLPSSFTTGTEADEIIALMQKESAMQESYERQKKMLEEMSTFTVEQEKNKLQAIKTLDDNYLRQRQSFEQQRNSVILQSMSSSFDQLAGVMKEGYGEQSGIYKAAFAVSKAFAIADASVKIAQGIAAAAALPWPANLGAMASVAAATAGLISNIQSVVLSFEGGGDTPSGPRRGGLDGRGGFFAIMHPNETVIDNTTNNSRGGNTQINVMNYGDSEVTAQTRKRDDGSEIVDLIVEKTVSRLTADVSQGRGMFNRTMQSSYPSLVRKGNR